MERNYFEEVMKIKNDIVQEMVAILQKTGKIEFTKPYLEIHYLESTVATTEQLRGLELSDGGSLIILTWNDGEIDGKSSAEMEQVFMYDTGSLISILNWLRLTAHEKMLNELRDIAKKNGGKLSLDGSFVFTPLDNADKGKPFEAKCKLTRIELDNANQNRVYLDCVFGKDCLEEIQEEEIPFDELARIVEYVRKQTKRLFVVRVSGSFSRTFDIEASSYEEALEFAKTEWKEDAPLCPADSNGEDWEDYTSRAH